MKKTFSILYMLLFGLGAISQEIPELKLTRNGVETIHIPFENFSTNELYAKSLAWVNATYKTPKDALKKTVLNDQILIEGFHKKAWWYKSMGIRNYNHMLYNVDFKFNEASITLKYTVGQFYLDEDVKVQYDYKMFFKKDGTIRNNYTDAVSSLEFTMNNLVHSLFNFVTGKEIHFEQKDLNKYYNSAYKNLATNPSDPKAHFEMACLYSLLEESEKSFSHLSKAVELGYSKYQKIASEPDLKWLRDQPNYNSFVNNGYKLKTKTSNKNYIEELKELAKLKEDGVLTEDEFNTLKNNIINKQKQQ